LVANEPETVAVPSAWLVGVIVPHTCVAETIVSLTWWAATGIRVPALVRTAKYETVPAAGADSVVVLPSLLDGTYVPTTTPPLDGVSASDTSTWPEVRLPAEATPYACSLGIA
jgi:hypothetical protein